MEIIQSIILGIIQGLTEFLPVSSSGHLALLQNYFGEVNVSFDILLHVATLLAVIFYFFRDIAALIRGFFSFSWKNENFRIAIYLAIATIPAGIAGYFLSGFIDEVFSSLLIVGIGFFISGIFLLAAGRAYVKKNKEVTLNESIFVGLAQALAIIPGISRSGSTTSTGILFGLTREKAVKFSFLLSVPIILGAIIMESANFSALDLISAAIGFICAFAFGIFAIFVFLKRVSLRNFRWFSLYCFILGVLSLVLYFF